MDNISFSALLQLQFIHDFPCVSRFVDTSDSPMWAIWQELLDAGYIIECQGYSKCGEELIENGAGYDITPAGNAFLLEFNKKLLEHDVTSIYLDKDEYKLLKTMLKRPDKEVAGKLWGDRIFEKCGIRRDEEGDGGKTLEIRGKRRLSARDGGANYQQS